TVRGEAFTAVAARSASQRGTNPRVELLRVERLRHVVVGAAVERPELVGAFLAHGEHNDRYRRVLARPLEDGEPTDAGQVEVETDEGGEGGFEVFDRGFAARDVDDIDVESAQSEAQCRPERRVVFDDQDLGPHHRLLEGGSVRGTVRMNVAPPPGVSSRVK